MKLLLIGSGGREHAIARQLRQSPRCTQLFIAPGNPGTETLGTNVPIKDSDIEGLIQFAKSNDIQLTIVGPEGPLVLGIVDRFEAEGLAIVGPNRVASQLEGSKKWAKDKMKAYGIPTAAYETFSEPTVAVSYIQTRNQFPIVIKADGLAAGKGVVIAQTLSEAETAIKDAMVAKKFSEAGSTIVVEAFLKGEETSIFAFTDGKTVLPMVSAQDHKAIFDGDQGPNTGGMGAYSPAPVVTDAVYTKVIDRIFKPLVDGFQRDGIVYKGIIFAGLMICDGEPWTIEFNARFGDPETQVVLPRLKTDLLDVFEAIANGTLDRIQLEWDESATVCVVMASAGYPETSDKGRVIKGLDTPFADDVWVVHAGTAKTEFGDIVTNGGRVLGVVAQRDDLSSAIEAAYQGVSQIKFDGQYNRKDIAAKGLRIPNPPSH
ncbi:phosphoribosylamine--glycine ligase [bacterium]|nr:phosphoribosylamine--glycine ligase [bacterium]